MATYQLLFGRYDWRESGDGPNEPLPAPARTEKLNVRLPWGLKDDVEEAAARDGLTPEAWAEKVLARSIRSDVATAN